MGNLAYGMQKVMSKLQPVINPGNIPIEGEG